MDITGAFRGSAAIAAGALTRGVLAGPRFRRLFPDIYAPAALPVDLALLSHGAHLLVEPRGILSGYSAAELLGASCGPEAGPAEVTCPWPRHPLPGLSVHRDLLVADEIVLVDGTALTSPVRTAFDLGRRNELVERVAAVDTLAHRYPFALDEIRALRSRHLGLPGSRGLEGVLALVDRRAQSPMESRMRVAPVRGGLPPAVQHPVRVGGRTFILDLAYPGVRLGVEFDGHHHRTAEQALRDLEREALLTDAGWKIIRFRARIVLRRPDVVVAQTLAALRRRAG